MSKRIQLTLASCMLLVSPVFASDTQTWVSPVYKAGATESKEIITIDHYGYREASYDPPIVVQRIRPEEARYDTPEYSFISRVSAMMSSNYDWWLSTWDDNGRALTLRLDAEAGKTPDAWVKQWDQVFSGARMMMVRRIVTGRYVVITYRLRALDGRPASSLELPAVLRQSGGRWFSTLDLRQDPLLPASPWISGRDGIEITVR